MSFDYRIILKTEFDRRCAMNGAYSLRAFSRDMGLTPPHLSAILSGKRGLSKQKALNIGQVLGLSSDELQQFVTDVSAKHGRSHTEKDQARQHLTILSQAKPRNFDLLKEAQFRVVADWHHFAILELSETEGFSWKPRHIASRLGLSVPVVSCAIDSLVRAGILKKNGSSYSRTKEYIRSEDVPSRAIRLNHLQYMTKAMKALEEQSLSERDFSSVTIAVDPRKLPELKRWLKDFREKFCVEANRGGKKTDVYNLSLQFFKLTQKPEMKETL